MAPSRGASEIHKNSNRPKTQRQSNQASKTHHRRPERQPHSYAAPSSSPSSPPLPVTLPTQQRLLNTFTSAFPDLLNPNTISTSLTPTLQEIKGYLYNRDFETAFGRPVYLEAYTARWSPSRALGYHEIFADVFAKHLLPPTEEDRLRDGDTEGHKEADSNKTTLPFRVTCLGGGAGAEVVALSKLHSSLPSNSLHVDAVDIANWSAVLSALITTHIAAAQSFTTTFTQADLLAPSNAPFMATLRNVQLVTLLFTLNELYTASLGRTQTFLLDLTRCVQSGTLLLVVDSPGSYASVKIAGNEKTYPMRWLLDHTLLKLAAELHDGEVKDGGDGDGDGDGKVDKAKWEKIEEHESRWFRVPEGLRYPIDLENMRYQMHLFRRI